MKRSKKQTTMSEETLKNKLILFQNVLDECIDDIKNLPQAQLRSEFYTLLKDLIAQNMDLDEKIKLLSFLDDVLFQLSEYFTKQKVAKNKPKQ